MFLKIQKFKKHIVRNEKYWFWNICLKLPSLQKCDYRNIGVSRKCMNHVLFRRYNALNCIKFKRI